jgi:hypothetical protein
MNRSDLPGIRLHEDVRPALPPDPRREYSRLSGDEIGCRTGVPHGRNYNASISSSAESVGERLLSRRGYCYDPTMRSRGLAVCALRHLRSTWPSKSRKGPSPCSSAKRSNHDGTTIARNQVT